MIVTDERVARFIAERLNFKPCPPYTVMGIERDGEIVAGLMFNGFEGFSINVSAAGSGWTRGFLVEVGRYVFDQLGCLRATFITADRSVGELSKRLGAQREGRLRDHFGPGRDGFVYGVLRDGYRYCVPREKLL